MDDSPLPPPSKPERPPLPPVETQQQAWQTLRDELLELNGQLEYLRLLLRLGVRPF